MRVDGNKRLFDHQGKGFAIGPDGGLLKNLLVFRPTVDFASVADGAVGGVEVTGLTGLALGDTIIGVAVDVDPGDKVSISGQVTATDTAYLTLRNNSGGAVDLASTTATIWAIQRQT